MKEKKQQAVPNNSLFSYDRQTKKIELVETITFEPNEIKKGTIKNYTIPDHPFKLYLQAINQFVAKQKFEKFFEYKRSQNEKKKVESAPDPQLQK